MPRKVNAFVVAEAIKQRFLAGLELKVFECHAKPGLILHSTVTELQRANVRFRPVTSTKPQAADFMILTRIHEFTLTYPHRTFGDTIVLITGDVDFVETVVMLREVGKFNVIVVHSSSARDEVLLAGTAAIPFAQVLNEIPPIPQPKPRAQSLTSLGRQSDNSITVTDPSVLRCMACGKNFKTANSLQQHAEAMDHGRSYCGNRDCVGIAQGCSKNHYFAGICSAGKSCATKASCKHNHPAPPTPLTKELAWS